MELIKRIQRSHIRKVWSLQNPRAHTTSVTAPMVFDGTMEIIFCQNNGFAMVFDDTTLHYAPGIYVGGQINRRMSLLLKPSTELVFYKVPPEYVHLLSRENLSVCVNQSVPLQDLNPGLFQKLSNVQCPSQLMLVLDALDSYFFQQSGDAFNALTSHLLSDVTTPYRLLKHQAMAQLGMSQRGFEQKFKRQVGISPKQFSHLSKLRALTEHLQFNAQRETLTTLAMDFGFCDQPHFNKSMREFLGQSPGKIDYRQVFVPDSSEALRFFTI